MRAQPADGSGTVAAAVDPRITYPCYKSFDEFLDTARLQSLDGYLTGGIMRHIAAGRDDLFLNEHRLDAASPYRPGVREIWLTRTLDGTPYNYLALDRPELWRPTAAAEEFSELMDFIATLPFKATGRMLVIYDDSGAAVPAHRDHLCSEVCHEFVWFRTNLKKPFYVLNHETNEKLYVGSYSAWFDTVNQFHGSDACDGLSFSVRVDGHFTDEFRARIPVPPYNAASTPALWACV
ncbi:MAG: hypothetical protein M3416_00785 [Acidobacteriota bacterium]|nr:hypothetical protein [Acidobacteriota bacterium]